MVGGVGRIEFILESSAVFGEFTRKLVFVHKHALSVAWMRGVWNKIEDKWRGGLINPFFEKAPQIFSFQFDPIRKIFDIVEGPLPKKSVKM